MSLTIFNPPFHVIYMKDVRQGIHSTISSLVQSIVYTQETSSKMFWVQQELDAYLWATQPSDSPEKKQIKSHIRSDINNRVSDWVSGRAGGRAFWASEFNSLFRMVDIKVHHVLWHLLIVHEQYGI